MNINGYYILVLRYPMTRATAGVIKVLLLNPTIAALATGGAGLLNYSTIAIEEIYS